MHLAKLVACSMVLAVGKLSAGPTPDYVVTVRQSYLPSATARRVAIVPVACPAAIKCDAFEEGLAVAIAAHMQLAAKAPWVREVMENAHLDKLDHETRYILAENLAADAFVIVEIQAADIAGPDPKLMRMGVPTRGKHVQLSVQIVTKDGVELLAASGEARVSGMLNSLTDIALRSVEACIEKAVVVR